MRLFSLSSSGITRECTPRPVDAGTAHARSGLEGSDLAIGQGALVLVVADRDGALRQILQQAVAGRLGDLVDHLGIGPVGFGIGLGAAFEGQHFEAGFGQLHRHDRPGPAETDDHHIDRFVVLCHQPRFP